MTKNDQRNAKIDQRILELIHEIRTEHHACSMRNIASRVRIKETAVRARLSKMRDAGLVGWTANFPGSLHLTEAGLEKVGVEVVVKEAEPRVPVACACGAVEDLGDSPHVDIAHESGAVRHVASGPCWYVMPGDVTRATAEAGPGAGDAVPDPATPEREVDNSRTTSPTSADTA